MKYVIIGNSAASLAAAKEIRKHDAEGSIRLISKESARPYSRVLLPYFLRGRTPESNLFIRKEDYFSSIGATCDKGEVLSLDPEGRTLSLADGSSLDYDRLLIATGSSPVKPPIPGLQGDNIHHMWTMADAMNLAPLFDQGGSMTVLGSGFVSLQAAWAALYRGFNVSVLELMPRIMPMVLDDRGAEILSAKMRKLGVDLRCGAQTQEVIHRDVGLELIIKDMEPIETDFMVVGTGVKPNVEFLQDTGLNMERGILVNRRMETNLPGVYAAGDVAAGADVFNQENTIHALWPTAVEHGQIAGANMAGHATDYSGSLNMNVTQMFELTVASMGKFHDDQGDTKRIIFENDDNYFKLVLQGDRLLGGVALGQSSLAKSLGLMKPLITGKKPITEKLIRDVSVGHMPSGLDFSRK